MVEAKRQTLRGGDILRRLIFNVSGQKIETNSNCNIDNIVAGSEGYLMAKFMFYGNSWKSLKKAARFVGEDGVEHAALLDTNDTCVVPAEVLDGAYFKVGAMGDTDEQQIVTDWVTIKQEAV